MVMMGRLEVIRMSLSGINQVMIIFNGIFIILNCYWMVTDGWGHVIGVIIHMALLIFTLKMDHWEKERKKRQKDFDDDLRKMRKDGEARMRVLMGGSSSEDPNDDSSSGGSYSTIGSAIAIPMGTRFRAAGGDPNG